MKKSLLSFAAIMILSFLIMSARSSDAAKKKSNPPKPAPVREQVVDGIPGEWLSNGQTMIEVQSTETDVTDPKGNGSQDGYVWYVAVISFRNMGNYTMGYGGSAHTVSLVDDKRTYYTETFARDENDWDQAADTVGLLPGDTLDALYVFAIPDNVNPVKLIIDPFPGSDQAKFRIRVKEDR